MSKDYSKLVNKVVNCPDRIIMTDYETRSWHGIFHKRDMFDVMKATEVYIQDLDRNATVEFKNGVLEIHVDEFIDEWEMDLIEYFTNAFNWSSKEKRRFNVFITAG